MTEKKKEVRIKYNEEDFSVLDIEGRKLGLTKIDKEKKEFVFEEIGEKDYEKLMKRVVKKIRAQVTAQVGDKEFVDWAVKEAVKLHGYTQLVDIDERLAKEKPSVKPRPGCFSLAIGGKSGAPVEFVISEGA